VESDSSRSDLVPEIIAQRHHLTLELSYRLRLVGRRTAQVGSAPSVTHANSGRQAAAEKALCLRERSCVLEMEFAIDLL
jgi:hypothetical protein